MANLFSTLKRAGTRANENLFPAPADGLMTADDIARARREGMLHLGLSLLGDTSGMGLGPALASAIPAGKQAYRGVAEDAYRQRGAARAERAAVRDEQNALKQDQLIARRNAIAAKYKLGADATPEQIFASFPRMYAELMAAGDMEGAKNLQGVVQQMLPKDKQGMTVDGKALIFDPEKGEFTFGPDIPMSADRKEQAELDRQLKLATISAQRAAAEAARESTRMQKEFSTGNQIGKAFISQHRKLLETEQKYQQWSASLESAKAGEPAAFKSAIVNFVNVADPGAQIRLGVLNFLSKLDPSVQGIALMKQAELFFGVHPMYLLESMENHVDKIHYNQIEQYANARDKRLRALGNPAYAQHIPDVDEAFPSAPHVRARIQQILPDAGASIGQGGSGNSRSGSSRVQQYLNGGAPTIAAPTRPVRPYQNAPAPAANNKPNPFLPQLDPNAGSFFPRR